MIIFGHGDERPDNFINSRPAFESLVNAGIDGVELDVRLSADDHLVVIHDPEYATGQVVRATPAKAKPTNVLALEEALDICSGMLVNIELKNYKSDPAFDASERLAEVTIELLRQRRDVDRVLTSSFGICCIDRVKSIAPHIDTAHLLLSRRPPSEILQPAIDHGHRIVHPYIDMVTDEFMDEAHAYNLKVNTWVRGTESDTSIGALLDLGVDGIITSNYSQVRRIVNDRQHKSLR